MARPNVEAGSGASGRGGRERRKGEVVVHDAFQVFFVLRRGRRHEAGGDLWRFDRPQGLPMDGSEERMGLDGAYTALVCSKPLTRLLKL